MQIHIIASIAQAAAMVWSDVGSDQKLICILNIAQLTS